MLWVFPSPLSGALGPPQPPSAPTQQVPPAGNWAQGWGQLRCHTVATAEGPEDGQGERSSRYAAHAHAHTTV